MHSERSASESSNSEYKSAGTPVYGRNSPPTSLETPISPPSITPRKRQRSDAKPAHTSTDGEKAINRDNAPSLAAIEAGKAEISDHVEYFARRLAQCIRPTQIEEKPLLSIKEFKKLYERCENGHAAHFVVHQHDHPVAGRLESRFSKTSLYSHIRNTQSWGNIHICVLFIYRFLRYGEKWC